jgi:hypothetical protein
VNVTYRQEFTHTYNYPDAVGIGVPVVLSLGNRKADLTAHIDTGASHCLFENAIARRLGLIVEHGYRISFSTANSRFEAFGHDVLMNVLGIEFETQVFFFADPEIRKNVLGRRGWLDRIRLGLVDYDQTLYLASYNFV